MLKRQRRKHFFFVNKKEAKKTLLTWGRWRLRGPRPPSTKVFWFFFLKKNSFLTDYFYPGSSRLRAATPCRSS
jgi:hypothetical protein